MTIKNEPIYSKIRRDNPRKVQVFLCNNFLQWGDCDAYYDWINSDYPFMHTHEHWELFLVTEGSITHSINGEIKMVSKGDACLIRPEDMHKLYFQKKRDAKFQLINFLMKKEWIESYLNLQINNVSTTLIESKDILYFHVDEILLGEIKQTCLQIQLLNSKKMNDCQTICKLKVEKLISEFLSQRILSIRKNPEWLDNLILYLNNPESFSKSIAEISSITSYSYSRLSHIFKEYFSISIIDYRNQIKLEYSKKLLLDSNEKIITISSILGFNSLSHYNHLFKATFGITPTEYKKQNISL